jgi:segregation and condensation protein A
MEQIVRRLEQTPRLAFAALFGPPRHRSRLVGLFLAVLELMKGRRITAEQADVFGEIWLCLAAPDRAEVPAGADSG